MCVSGYALQRSAAMMQPGLVGARNHCPDGVSSKPFAGDSSLELERKEAIICRGDGVDGYLGGCNACACGVGVAPPGPSGLTGERGNTFVRFPIARTTMSA